MGYAIRTEKRETWTIDVHPEPERCLDWMRDNVHDLYFWGDENRDSLNAFCAHFGLVSLDWEVGFCRPSYASAKTADADIANLAGVRLWKYLQNSGLLRHYSQYNRFRNERVELLAGDCPFTGYYMDESLLDPVREFMARPDSRTFQDLMDDCLGSWVSAFVADWEYAYSDDGLREVAECNEMEFTENGSAY